MSYPCCYGRGMNNNLTHIAFILDRSGSMDSMAKEAIGGFNAFIEEQIKEPGLPSSPSSYLITNTAR